MYLGALCTRARPLYPRPARSVPAPGRLVFVILYPRPARSVPAPGRLVFVILYPRPARSVPAPGRLVFVILYPRPPGPAVFGSLVGGICYDSCGHNHLPAVCRPAMSQVTVSYSM